MSSLPPVRDRAIRPDSRRCVNCSLLLGPNLRRFMVEELNEQMLSLLRFWITPTAISSEDIICNECYALLLEQVLLHATQPQEDLHPVFGHQNVCFGCGISIATRKTRRVSLECAQRNIILRWTPAHQVAHLEKICCACWIAATRQVQREALHDNSRETDNMSEEIAVGDSNIEMIESPLPHLCVLAIGQLNYQQVRSLNHHQYLYKKKFHSSVRTPWQHQK